MKHFLKLSIFALLILCASSMANASSSTKQKASKASKDILTGWFVSDGYSKRAKGYDWVAVNITKEDGARYRISARSKGNMKRPTCTLDCYASAQGNNELKAIENNKAIIFKVSGNKLSVYSEKQEDAGALSFCCSGGASLAGTYARINGAIDTKQIDKTVYTKWLEMGQISFAIEQLGSKLTIRPIGFTEDQSEVSLTVDAKAYDSEVGDLNNDGYPEVLVYLRDSKGYGKVIGYSANKDRSMSSIAFSGISERKDLKKGYYGHDDFAIVESSFVQRFPLFKDSKGAVKTGKIRQIQYKMKDGEASRHLSIDKTIEY